MSDQVFIESRLCDFELPPQGTKKFYHFRTCMLMVIKYQNHNSPVRALLTDFTSNDAVEDNFSSEQKLSLTGHRVPSNQLLQVRWKTMPEFSEFLKSYHRLTGENLKITGNFTNTSENFIFVNAKISVKDYRGTIDGDIEFLEMIPKDQMDPENEVIKRYFKLAGKDLLDHISLLKRRFPKNICQRYTSGDYNRISETVPAQTHQKQQQRQNQHYQHYQHSYNREDVANIYTQASSPIPEYAENDYNTDTKRDLSTQYDQQQQANLPAAKRQKFPVSNTIPFRKLNEIALLDDTMIYSVSGYVIGIQPNFTACHKNIYGKLEPSPVRIYFSETPHDNSSGGAANQEDVIVISFDTVAEILTFYAVKHIEEVFVYESYFRENMEKALETNRGVPMTLKIQRKRILKGPLLSTDRTSKMANMNNTFYTLGWGSSTDLTMTTLNGGSLQ
ncbi:hypothetical protein WICPIJ_001432 [Wickerhamomyces pijperi]|uniref:Uncharacterized protein n=1 Tax=Wickerhamomyces pijperi TaxID=599730 RepID=A0A9P8QDM5_WICPI|nr:hypothetical protein WICPIJ_001432 [Wickerhamomyces pijperi]